jgi:SAM-dependent methyltransferase
LAEITYDQTVFAVRDLQEAMAIILTPEDSTTEERWRQETGYLADMIEMQLEVSPASLLLDYGCGIGRLSKELIQRQECTVVGVDISPHMRMLSLPYVGSDRFLPASREALDMLLVNGVRFDAAFSVWCLQHCHRPEEDIALIQAALKPGAPLFIVNNDRRAVPTREAGWVDDGLDVKGILEERFILEETGRPHPQSTTPRVSELTFWARFRGPAEEN